MCLIAYVICECLFIVSIASSAMYVYTSKEVEVHNYFAIFCTLQLLVNIRLKYFLGCGVCDNNNN